jgi:hypothetical protein
LRVGRRSWLLAIRVEKFRRAKRWFAWFVTVRKIIFDLDHTSKLSKSCSLGLHPTCSRLTVLPDSHFLADWWFSTMIITTMKIVRLDFGRLTFWESCSVPLGHVWHWVVTRQLLDSNERGSGISWVCPVHPGIEAIGLWVMSEKAIFLWSCHPTNRDKDEWHLNFFLFFLFVFFLLFERGNRTLISSCHPPRGNSLQLEMQFHNW